MRGMKTKRKAEHACGHPNKPEFFEEDPIAWLITDYYEK